MKYSLILNKFEIDLNRLKKKLKSFEIDKLTGRINTDEKVELEEVDKILVLENENFFSLEDLRKDISKIKFNNFNLRVKSYVKIPSGTIKKKLYPVVNKKLNENSENNILIELFKEGKIKYRIFSYKEMKNENENNITILIENPRLVEEISDFLRLCLIFKLNLKVIHNNKKEFENLLNKAKKLTKGRLSEFNVEVVKDLKELNYFKIGFSKHAKRNEKDFIKFVKEKKNLLFVFGNDTFGLSQKVRDDLDASFSLGKDKIKPMKGNQALAYVLGLLKE